MYVTAARRTVSNAARPNLNGIGSGRRGNQLHFKNLSAPAARAAHSPREIEYVLSRVPGAASADQQHLDRPSRRPTPHRRAQAQGAAQGAAQGLAQHDLAAHA
ncbi:MAG: hypothetical protein IM626_13300 [Phenylobacterium sp.]|nr:hypothetical protein [Phenylobacterium sp.]MCA6311765.1 hypothetical protein [Phenylobacterium sp.]MCA6339005.1 hypothetical protein [Phenylobacterium sp.]MCA6350693.1 hypothetical protein [Phenylobacterium sp.]MCA6354391.1 hypothetical protein [Phenylobacterium sp.]MCA6361010.1 hypothetical protein [Phenylobacterium sp.]